MAKKRVPPPNAPLLVGGQLHPMWMEFFEHYRLMATTQSDMATVSNPPTQAEVNAMVTAFNALIDKLQAARGME